MQGPRICILEIAYAEVCTNFYGERSNLKNRFFDELLKIDHKETPLEIFSAWNPYCSTAGYTTKSCGELLSFENLANLEQIRVLLYRRFLKLGVLRWKTLQKKRTFCDYFFLRDPIVLKMILP